MFLSAVRDNLLELFNYLGYLYVSAVCNGVWLQDWYKYV